MVRVEVIYARPERQWCVELDLDTGTSAAEALEIARNSEPLLWVDELSVVGYAVWGHEVPGEYRLKNGDRLELLRSLPVDPMETRRRKAAAQKD